MFKREDRYLVFKKKDLTPDQLRILTEWRKTVQKQRLEAGKDILECLVVEADWPEYEPTWEAIQLRMEDKMFQKYRRTNVAEMRPYILGEDLSGVSVSDVDTPETDMGMIARNPKNHADQWYVARKYFEDNFEPLDR